MLRRLPADNLPLVIFLTAHDQHALAAFEAQAVDYLLKPIDDERLARALGRARLLIASRELSEIKDRIRSFLRTTGDPSPRHRTHITVKTGRRATIISVSDIDWISADGDYVTLHVKDKSFLARQTIGSLESELDSEQFLRVHRSTIVNKSEIAELTTMENGGFLIRLRNGTELRTSRSCSQRLTEWL